MTHKLLLIFFTLLIFNLSLAQDTAKYKVSLELGTKESPIRPKYSATGTKLPLKSKKMDGLEGYDHMVTEITIRPGGQLIAVARSKEREPYDILFIDKDLDGSLEGEEAIKTKAYARSKTKAWWSSFTGELYTEHHNKVSLPEIGDYPVALWIVVDNKEEKPEIIRYSGKGFFAGSTEIDSVKYHIYLKGMNNDGVMAESAFWGLKAEGIEEELEHRRINDYTWANGKAWKIKLENTIGTEVTLTEFQPAVTQQEDMAERDPYRADRDAERAEKALYFEKDYHAALAKASEEKKAFLIKFETDWCGPCKVMNSLVFTAKNVVEAANDIVCLKIDGDLHKDLVEKYKVVGYPHFILLDHEGNEIKRVSGYQSCKQIVSFLQ